MTSIKEEHRGVLQGGGGASRGTHKRFETSVSQNHLIGSNVGTDRVGSPKPQNPKTVPLYEGCISIVEE